VAAPPAADPDHVVVGDRLALRSVLLGEDRVSFVARPPGWTPAEGPVPFIYVLDGEAHFAHAATLVRFLAVAGRMPPAVVVGVGTVDRARDLTPTPDPRRPRTGGADRFLDFLERELLPAGEEGLPARPFRILVGHSLGGLLAIHALTGRPGLFDATVAISPSLPWGDALELARTRALFLERPGLDATLYLTIGDEAPQMLDASGAYAELLRDRAPSGLRWRYEELGAEDHGSIVHRGIYLGLEHAFDGWRPPAGVDTLAALEAHHREVAARFRVPAALPEGRLNILGYRLLAAGRVDDGVAVFRRNVELHPDSANVHDSLGEALEARGDREAAVASYERAVKTAAANRDPLLEVFMQHLERARRAVRPGRSPSPR
jgi:predicted alpha/beta superfamily hydrolase